MERDLFGEFVILIFRGEVGKKLVRGLSPTEKEPVERLETIWLLKGDDDVDEGANESVIEETVTEEIEVDDTDSVVERKRRRKI